MHSSEPVMPAHTGGIRCVPTNIAHIRHLVSAFQETVSSKHFPSERGAATLIFKGESVLTFEEISNQGLHPRVLETTTVRDLVLSTDSMYGARGDSHLVMREQTPRGFSFDVDAVSQPNEGGTVLLPVSIEQIDQGLRFRAFIEYPGKDRHVRISWVCPSSTAVTVSTKEATPCSTSTKIEGNLPAIPKDLHSMEQSATTSRLPILTHTFAIAVVENEGKFLLVKERKTGGTWYLPAGRVELGETIFEAVVRETKEEAGVDVIPSSILSIDHTPALAANQASRMRVIFTCKASGALEPKSISDEHSLGAAWVTPEQAEKLELRHPEVVSIIRAYLRARNDSRPVE